MWTDSSDPPLCSCPSTKRRRRHDEEDGDADDRALPLAGCPVAYVINFIISPAAALPSALLALPWSYFHPPPKLFSVPPSPICKNNISFFVPCTASGSCAVHKFDMLLLCVHRSYIYITAQLFPVLSRVSLFLAAAQLGSTTRTKKRSCSHLHSPIDIFTTFPYTLISVIPESHSQANCALNEHFLLFVTSN